jgi:hypothetical protein
VERSTNDRKQDLCQPGAIYRHIESWWGEKFDDKLVERIVEAPWEHQMRFLGTLDFLIAKTPESELDEIPSGVLHPALSGRELMNDVRPRQVSDGLRLLL